MSPASMRDTPPVSHFAQLALPNTLKYLHALQFRRDYEDDMKCVSGIIIPFASAVSVKRHLPPPRSGSLRWPLGNTRSVKRSLSFLCECGKGKRFHEAVGSAGSGPRLCLLNPKAGGTARLVFSSSVSVLFQLSSPTECWRGLVLSRLEMTRAPVQDELSLSTHACDPRRAVDTGDIF
jgi:hypothetical protein